MTDDQTVCAVICQLLNHFIIYYVMKYRKILIKYNAYILQPWKYKNLYFHSSENTRFDINYIFFYFLNMV